MHKRLTFLSTLLLLSLNVHADAIKQVKVLALNTLLSEHKTSAPAQVISLNHALIAAQTSGRIIELPLFAGMPVKKGDLIAKLDCEQHQARLAAAQATLRQISATLNFANAEFKRAQNLKKKKSISTERFDKKQLDVRTAVAQRAQQQQQIKALNIDIEHCTIQAPFDGIISQRHAQLGELASAGSSIARILQSDQQEVSAKIQQIDLTSLQAAKEFDFVYLNQHYPVTLRAQLPIIDSTNNSRESRFSFVDKKALVGASGRLQWSTGQTLLAAKHIVRRNKQLGVFTIANAKARFHSFANAQEGQAVIITDLSLQTIVVEGQQSLQDGDAVSIVK